MKSHIFLGLITISCSFCRDPAQAISNTKMQNTDTISPQNYSQYLKLAEKESAQKQYDHLGKHISTIGFQVLDTAFNHKGGSRDWVNLEKPELDLQNLQSPTDIIFPGEEFTLMLDYPLKAEFKFEIKCAGGCSRQEFVRLVSEKYHQIYKEEERTATVKTIPIEKRVGVYNRNLTDGQFGIWGHDLSDLVLSEAHIYKDSKGRYIVSLDIQS